MLVFNKLFDRYIKLENFKLAWMWTVCLICDITLPTADSLALAWQLHIDMITVRGEAY